LLHLPLSRVRELREKILRVIATVRSIAPANSENAVSCWRAKDLVLR
jgi:hypothetical protein